MGRRWLNHTIKMLYFHDQSVADARCCTGLPPANMAPTHGPARIAHLASERERQELEQALAPQVTARMVSSRWLQRQPREPLKVALSQELLGGYHVLHEIGHGEYERSSIQGELCFEDAVTRACTDPKS